jgi:hypothetical protein
MEKPGLKAWVLGLIVFSLLIALLVLMAGKRCQSPSTQTIAAPDQKPGDAVLTNAIVPVAHSATASVVAARELSFDPAFLKRLRREWNGQNPAPDPSIPEDRQLLLVNRVISTVAPAPAAKADIWLNRTRRGTLPFLIQFSGPVQDDWQEAVRKTGVVMLQYMPHNGWLVEANPATLKSVQSLPVVRWAGVFEAGDKIQPFLKRLTAAFPDDRRRIRTSILCLSPDDLAPVTEWLRGKGMTVRVCYV